MAPPAGWSRPRSPHEELRPSALLEQAAETRRRAAEAIAAMRREIERARRLQGRR